MGVGGWVEGGRVGVGAVEVVDGEGGGSGDVYAEDRRQRRMCIRDRIFIFLWGLARRK